jgi:DNA-binding CsgD family transcriptional regulator
MRQKSGVILMQENREDRQSVDVCLFRHRHLSKLPPRLESVLTGREREILLQILQGESIIDIATALGLSIRTVRNRLQALYLRFGVHSRRELENLVHDLLCTSSQPPA